MLRTPWKEPRGILASLKSVLSKHADRHAIDQAVSGLYWAWAHLTVAYPLNVHYAHTPAQVRTQNGFYNSMCLIRICDVDLGLQVSLLLCKPSSAWAGAPKLHLQATLPECAWALKPA